MNHRTTWLLLAAIALLVGGLTGAAAVQASEEEVPAGQAIFLAQKCDMCHAVSTVGIEAKTKSATMLGGDLVDLECEADWLALYLKKETQLEGEDHKKAFKGPDEDLQAMIQWLLEQKTDG